MDHRLLSLTATFILGVSTAAFAVEVEARLQTSALSFSGGSGFTNAVLFITGPNDFEEEETASRGLPVFRVQGGQVKDGFYHYTLTAATDEKVTIKRPVDNGRGSAARDYTLKPFNLSGMFQIKEGRIVPQDKMSASADGDAEEN